MFLQLPCSLNLDPLIKLCYPETDRSVLKGWIMGKGEKTRADGELPDGTLVDRDLSAAVDAILKETTP